MEKSLEEKIVTAIKGLDLDGVEIVSSRSSAAAGYVKGEKDSAAKQIIAVAVGLRAHDAFSLPTVNVSGSLNLTTRAEMCPTGAEHEATMSALAELFSGWHLNGGTMSTALDVADQFFAAELRMDGGTGKTYDSELSAWTESFSFTIRGTLLENNNNN